MSRQEQILYHEAAWTGVNIFQGKQGNPKKKPAVETGCCLDLGDKSHGDRAGQEVKPIAHGQEARQGASRVASGADSQPRTEHRRTPFVSQGTVSRKHVRGSRCRLARWLSKASPAFSERMNPIFSINQGGCPLSHDSEKRWGHGGPFPPTQCQSSEPRCEKQHGCRLGNRSCSRINGH